MFIATLEAGETALLHESLPGMRKEPSELVVSDRAIYLPTRKPFSFKPDALLRRIPLQQVRSVSLEPVRSVAVAILCFFGALAQLAFFFMYFIEDADPDRGTAFLIGLMVATMAAVPLALERRPSLRIVHDHGTFRWKPFPFGDVAKRKVRFALDRIVASANEAGLATRT